MPWTARDALRHTSAANTGQKRQRWAKIANEVLHATGDEGRAIRAANASVGHRDKEGQR